ncbi:sensor histidine kinase [Corallococcus sp. AB004]|uniref:sensor histidine kinase n=1 Tax=Corallococcus exiguus TaxID=83462 RepID=UPI000EA11C7E|nr:sensor histidine kinase [Corallococcus sp. AB004]
MTKASASCPRSLQIIFEKFTHTVSSRYFRGLGLGHFITRQIVKTRHGTLRAVSQPGQCATFIVELPLG